MLKRKDKILISAIELLEESGISGVTTKRLAAMQGVSEPALYRQYKSKLDIIKHIIEEYNSYDEKIMNTILQSEMSGKEAILFFLKRYCELYQNYSELTTVMFSMDVYFYNDETKARMEEVHKRKKVFLNKLVKEAIENGSNHIFDVEELTEMINSLIFSTVYDWRMNNKVYILEDKMIPIANKLL